MKKASNHANFVTLGQLKELAEERPDICFLFYQMRFYVCTDMTWAVKAFTFPCITKDRASHPNRTAADQNYQLAVLVVNTATLTSQELASFLSSFVLFPHFKLGLWLY